MRQYPELSFVADQGRQYVVGGLWRHREDIGELIEVSSGSYRAALVDRVVASLVTRNARLLVLDFGFDVGDSRFCRENGFSVVERIVEYDRPSGPISGHDSQLMVRAYAPEDRDVLLQLDHDAFPWLWWNSPTEWDTYLRTSGVHVLVGVEEQTIVGYAGVTVRGKAGHLDRLAVRGKRQGRGYGAALLAQSLYYMQGRGAHKVSLTTQDDNYRSQALYERFGFRRSRWTYEILGKWLVDPEDMNS